MRGSPRLVWLLVAATLAACSSKAPLETAHFEPPETRRGDVVDDFHGTKVADPYRWLEDIDSDETKAWIDAQNGVSRPYLEQLPTRKYFVQRLAELESATSPGELRRQGSAWIERNRTPDGDVELVIRDGLDQPPRLRLDRAALGLGDGDLLDSFRLSPGARRLAFTVSDGGSRFLELRVLDLDRGELLDDRIENLKFSMPHWTADGEHLVYWRYLNADAQNRFEVDRGALVAVHRLGTSNEDDRVLIRREDSEATGASTWTEVSADGRFVVVFYGTNRSVQLSAIDLGDPLRPNWDVPVVELMDERDGDHNFAGSLGSTLYFRTTRSAPLGQIVAIDVKDPTDWQTVVPEDEHLLQHALVVGGRLVCAYRRDVKSALVVFETDGAKVREVPLPAPGSTFHYGGTPDAPDLTFGFDGMAVPARQIHYDVESGDTRTLDERRIPGFESSDYVSRQVFYESQDGTRIPMFISHRKNAVQGDETQSGSTPTVLHGYGATGAVMDPIFRDDLFAWMEAGGLVAIANVRGGGEYGEAWADAGKLDRKQTTYDDFVAAAEYLISEGITSPRHLASLGYSNGGMLVGAVMTQRPDLFAATLPVVGVLDALRFPQTTAGPRWAKTQGDAGLAEQFPWVYAWSPLHRIEDGRCYPATLVLTAANDDIVHPSQSYKFAARLQAAQGCGRPAVLRVLESGGHSFFDRDHVANAEILAFAARHTGLTLQE